MTSSINLLSKYKLNDLLTLKNRIVMAPMTRGKAADDLVPTDAMKDFYSRRAEAGLLITEATVIRPDGLGYHNIPGIFNDKQISHWKKVTDSVHQQQGLIFLQIWHVGRVSHPNFLNGDLPIAPSATTMKSRIHRSEGLFHGESREATLDEIKGLIKSYETAAINAIEAGFDGVDIHGANGYLIDQFLHASTNLRSDEYGGSSEKKAKFALDVIKACGKAIGYERVGIRLSPGAYLHEIIGEPADAETFKYLLQQLNNLNIAYVHTGSFNDANTYPELNNLTMTAFMRQHYEGTLIACGSYTIESATQGINQNKFDLVAFGRPFIANPDLITRIRRNEELKPYDESTLNTIYY